MSETIQIVEVGPRDGLQNEAAVLEPTVRAEFVRRLEDCGVTRIEAASFVNPKRVPQMAGAEEIMEDLPHRAGLSRIGLALNRRGWDRAVAAGCDEANVVVCATDGFGIRNQGAGVAEQLAALADIVAARKEGGGPPISLTVSVAFGCPFDGEVSEEQVAAIVRAGAELGIGEIALADTIGVADPWTVKRRLAAARAAAPDATLRVHFAPGATGNIATEDLVWMLHRAGFDTGLDVDGLVAAGRWIGEKIGKAPISALSRAGGFP
jgi:hydroxymethylglutaryl-CoA lyase